MRLILTVGIVFGLAGTAAAQFPTQPGPAINPDNFLPNYFNPRYQPLSPYLNLLRGGNPATNYFYGVRPGTLGVGPRAFGGGAPFIAGGGNRTLFFPQLATAPDPLAADPTFGQPGNVLPPAGHQVVFSNTMGFFPSPFGQAGGARPGLSGLGASRGGR
jgi:hypothetical protein